jgi:hypothetical protein
VKPRSHIMYPLVALLALTWPAVAPAPSKAAEGTAVTTAERINYFLAVQKWQEREQERRISESANKAQVLASARSSFREIRELVFDTEALPADFKEAFLRSISSQEEAIDLLEQLPDLENPWAILGFGLNLGKDYVFKNKDTLTSLKERAERIVSDAKEAAKVVDSVAIRHGARSDWQAMPRVREVIAGGHADRLGIKKGDFLFSYDGTKLFRRLHNDLVDKAKEDHKTEVEWAFLTPHGILRTTLSTSEIVGVKIDTTCAQPPVAIKLIPYAISSGYYVNVINVSQDINLEEVVVRYIDANGKDREQRFDMLAAKSPKLLDPSEVKWRIAKGESIAVKAKGYVERHFETTRMIK